MAEHSEFHLECECGHEFVAALNEGTCLECGREWVVRHPTIVKAKTVVAQVWKAGLHTNRQEKE